MIDNVIELMDYPFPAISFYTAKARRSIGVGIVNLAYDMASKGYKYSTLGGKTIHSPTCGKCTVITYTKLHYVLQKNVSM